MELSAQHRRFLLVEQGAIPMLFNLLLNGGIAWVLFRTDAAIPLWGSSSVAVDLLATAFLLPFLTCLIVTALVAHQVHSGNVPSLLPGQLPLSRWYQRSPAARGVWLGTAGILFGAVPLVWALSLGDAQPLPFPSYVVFKAVWAALLAFLVTPIVGWWALASASSGVVA